MTTMMTVSEARAALAEVVDRVLAGEEFTLTRHGVAVAVIVRPDALRARRADRVLGVSAGVHELLEQGRRTALSDRPTINSERAEELIKDVRAARSRR
jgi:antitoxin (DNA-binding transcriptional repressor) of toxin-antitoxin stability system